MRHVAVVNAVDEKQKGKNHRHYRIPSPTRRSLISIQERSCPRTPRTKPVVQYCRACSRNRRSSSTRRAFFSRSNLILWASVPSSMSDSLNQGCWRASLAVMRFLGSYTKMRRSRSRNCRLKSVWAGMVSYDMLVLRSSHCFATNNTYGKLLHCLDVFLRRLVGFRIGVVQLVVFEISCGAAIMSVGVSTSSDLCVYLRAG